MDEHDRDTAGTRQTELELSCWHDTSQSALLVTSSFTATSAAHSLPRASNELLDGVSVIVAKSVLTFSLAAIDCDSTTLTGEVTGDIIDCPLTVSGDV